jgi:hypothetical protein
MVGMLLLGKGNSLRHNYKLYGDAKVLHQRVLTLWQDMQCVENGVGNISAFVGLAEIAASERQGACSGWLFGAADHLAPTSGVYRDTLNELESEARGNLDAATSAAFEAGLADGMMATLEQAIQNALQEVPASP